MRIARVFAQASLLLDDLSQLAQEKAVDRRCGMDIRDRAIKTQQLSDRVDAVVCTDLNVVEKRVPIHSIKARCMKMRKPDLQRPDRLQQTLFKGPPHAHNLAGCLHLGAQRAAGIAELIEGKARHFGDHIVQSRLKRRGCVGKGDLLQVHADPDFSRHAGYRVTAGF